MKRTNGPYLDIVAKHWWHIVRLYLAFEDRRPVMLFDVQEMRVYAYPCAESRADLFKRSQRLLERQYNEASREDKILVFVRDNEQRQLVSYCLA